MAETPTRIAIVTGASRGIGAAIAEALATQGRHVVLLARNAGKLETVKSQIESVGGTASVLCCDVSDQQAIEDAINAVATEHKRLDILVNNAGITRDNLLLRMSNEEFDAVLNTNLRSVFIACRTALRPMMRGRWGRIINISSVAGLVGNAGQANYAASKAGVVGFTRSIAKEMAAKQITANVIAPGFIETDMTDILSQQAKDRALEVTPLRRFGTPNEVAAAAVYLASEDAGYTSGQVLAIDGGMTMT